jgi:ribosomal protein S4
MYCKTLKRNCHEYDESDYENFTDVENCNSCYLKKEIKEKDKESVRKKKLKNFKRRLLEKQKSLKRKQKIKEKEFNKNPVEFINSLKTKEV